MRNYSCSNQDIIIKFNYLMKIISKTNETEYYQEVLRCLTEMKAYNDELYEHSENVAFYSILIASIFYKNKKEIMELYTAALLHDYGKIFIPKNIIEKPGILSKNERRKIELHSIAGYIFLKQHTSLPSSVLCGILDHHEKVDGSGYILCKKGYRISNYAKIISIADVYDSMISDRVYRKQIPKIKVKEYIKSKAGSHFDNNLSLLFLTMINDISENDLIYMKKIFKYKIGNLNKELSFYS